mmetsp:Transcript_87782/g.146521  ORF Transcript_87782/g.146521 Transcript_87782/m.146521 type:complete len:301 (+) Transcript_87782:963-1865(+)
MKDRQQHWVPPAVDIGDGEGLPGLDFTDGAQRQAALDGRHDAVGLAVVVAQRNDGAEPTAVPLLVHAEGVASKARQEHGQCWSFMLGLTAFWHGLPNRLGSLHNFRRGRRGMQGGDRPKGRLRRHRGVRYHILDQHLQMLQRHAVLLRDLRQRRVQRRALLPQRHPVHGAPPPALRRREARAAAGTGAAVAVHAVVLGVAAGAGGEDSLLAEQRDEGLKGLGGAQFAAHAPALQPQPAGLGQEAREPFQARARLLVRAHESAGGWRAPDGGWGRLVVIGGQTGQSSRAVLDKMKRNELWP